MESAFVILVQKRKYSGIFFTSCHIYKITVIFILFVNMGILKVNGIFIYVVTFYDGTIIFMGKLLNGEQIRNVSFLKYKIIKVLNLNPTKLWKLS